MKTIVCPALPLRCSDRKEYSELKELPGPLSNMTLTLSTRLYWKGVGRQKLEENLYEREKPCFFPRGSYKVEDHSLKLRDWCGFFEYRIPCEKNKTLTVFPATRHLERGIPARRNQVAEKKAFISWQKDNEYYDARPYFPGDDPRRINWKMLARHDELFIREGNSFSPSKKSALLLLDGSGSREETDMLFRRFSALTEQLSQAGLQLTVHLPGKVKIKGLEKYSASEKEDLFASVHPEKLKSLNINGEDQFGIIYFFSAVKPDDSFLRPLDAAFPDSRKVLVLSSSVSGDVKGKAKGWNLVQP